ncbi:MAG: LacI family DNA-binding transcriptional regulator [Candidatus Latescibacteria bacterium]|nr:LacI family DNA-binding transcriptional regulator [Candidatus Latescibacterota bacterium]
MSVTIKDIAKAVGVSHSTVSRALNKSSLVNIAYEGAHPSDGRGDGLSS